MDRQERRDELSDTLNVISDHYAVWLFYDFFFDMIADYYTHK